MVLPAIIGGGAALGGIQKGLEFVNPEAFGDINLTGIGDLNKYNAKETGLPLIFPSALQDNPNRPQIRLTCFEENTKGKNTTIRSPIYLPCPSNIAFADNANLGSIELGIGGANLTNLFNSAQTNPQGAVAQSAGGFFEGLAKIGGAGLKSLGGVGEKLVAQGSFAAKIVANPFQNTTFGGNGIRSFTFNFKFVAKSQEEAVLIKLINERFRLKMYSGGQLTQGDRNAAFVKYPAIWEIEFITGLTNEGYKVNPYIPAIYASYISSFNSTFNTTAAAWHQDGAPLEVDMSITFQEARALTGQDIRNLERISNSGSTGYQPGVQADEDIENPESNTSLRGISAGGGTRTTGWVFSEEGQKIQQALADEKAQENLNQSSGQTGSDIFGTGGGGDY
jgi:hypothetical protein